jgi:predicted MarR family transcription regulator
MQPWSPTDINLLAAVANGEFLLHGFRNRDLASRLYDEPATDDAERKRRSARVSRLLRLLRAHGLIEKVTKTHSYRITNNGNSVIAAILGVRELPLTAIKEAA